MEALVPAFVAALFSQIGDRSPWLAAILADRYGKPLTVALAATMAHALGNGVAVFGAVLIAPMMTPNARSLLLALALLFAAAGALWRMRAPDPLTGWRLGAIATTFLGIFILALGDSTQFFTLAIATRAPMPWLAAVGATLGALAINGSAALLGEAAWRALPLRALRIGTGVIFLVSGLIVGLSALRLI